MSCEIELKMYPRNIMQCKTNYSDFLIASQFGGCKFKMHKLTQCNVVLQKSLKFDNKRNTHFTYFQL